MKTPMRNFLAKFFIPILIIVSFEACKTKPMDVSPAIVNPASGTGSFIFNGTTYSGTCTIFSNNMSQAGRLDEVIIGTSAFGVGYSPQFIIDYMPTASSGTFQFAANATSPTPYQQGTVYGDCFIIKGQGSSQADYNVKSGTLTKTGANSFSFTCVMYNTSNSTATFNVTGSGTYK